MADRIDTNLTPAQTHDIITDILNQIVGMKAAEKDVVLILEACGFALLNIVKEEFVVKSRGGTDAAGIKWPYLSAKYLAYGRRFGPGEQAALKKGAGLGKSHAFGPGRSLGLLTKAQLKIWKGIFASNLAKFVAQGMDAGEAKAKAAKIAWAIIKSKYGGKTKIDVYGKRLVEMLRDTGVLFNSLSYTIHRGAIEVGTKVEYASSVFAKRPAWPATGDLPAKWLEPVYDVLWSGITDCIARRLAT
jgi:hypothetical protein